MPHSINLSTVLLVFAGALFLSILLLSNTSKVGWKRMDMAALLLSAFGLFPATFDSQQWFATGERNATRELADKNATFTIEAFDMWWRQQNCEAADANSHPEAQQHICRWLGDQKANIRDSAEHVLADQGAPSGTGQQFSIAIESLRNFPLKLNPRLHT